ncbi:MAG: DUF4352 domain-containing protein [Candidatus Moraniibacteriota bacterium]|nr:MAG: DUF4352 domain-containing protein [Candidatus Moranbacteria bacterium]
MKTCKSCKKEIDNEAKKCPYCQTDQRIWFAKHPILTVILSLILIGVVSGGSGGDSSKTSSSTQNETKTTESSKPAEAIHKVGETFNTGKMDFTLTSADNVNSVGSQYLNEKASEGATLVVVLYKYKNTSDKPLASYTQPDIKLVDSSGTEYDPDLGKTSTYKVQAKIDEKFLSDLNPGITVNAAQVFEVSKDSYSLGTWQIKVKADGSTYYVGVK